MWPKGCGVETNVMAAEPDIEIDIDALADSGEHIIRGRRAPAVAVIEPDSASVDRRAAGVRVGDAESIFHQHMYILVATCLKIETAMNARNQLAAVR